jgi:hypothetical protein
VSNKQAMVYRTESKDIRRQVHELHKHPIPRVMQLNEIKRPAYVTLLTGERVKYEGP